MTIKDFKKLCPEKAHLEGNELWDAMEDFFLQNKDICVKQPPPRYNVRNIDTINQNQNVTFFVDKKIYSQALENRWKEYIKNAKIISLN